MEVVVVIIIFLTNK